MGIWGLVLLSGTKMQLSAQRPADHWVSLPQQYLLFSKVSPGGLRSSCQEILRELLKAHMKKLQSWYHGSAHLPNIEPGTASSEKAVTGGLKLPLHLMSSCGLLLITLFFIFQIPAACSFCGWEMIILTCLVLTG